MTERSRFEAVAAAVEREADRLRRVSPPLAAARELFYEEIHGSTALAGSKLTPAEVRDLLENDRVAAGRSLAENVLVADYGEAARFVRAAPPPRRRSYLALEEIATAHSLAVRRTTGARAGRWRETTAAALPSGMVPPPAWLVPREIAAFVERFAGGPPAGAPALEWIASAHARFSRIHPFDTANGRAARLVTNLLLRRSGFPPFVVRRRDGPRYVAALRRADSRDTWPLALAIARNVLESLGMLLQHANADDDSAEAGLAPLARFATGSERAALYKAAQRGRLRTVSQRGALLTSRAWIDAYRAPLEPARSEAARHLATPSEERGDGDDLGDARPL